MNKLQVQFLNWHIEDGHAFPLDATGRSFISFVEPGDYAGSQLEPVWQCKFPKSDWWDNLPTAPSDIIRAKYQTRLVIREVTTSDDLEPSTASFQDRVQPWLLETFGAVIAGNITKRNHRFLEEAIELVQSTGCTASEAHMLVDYVFTRPVGEPYQEVGGVMVTLAALCLATGLDMAENGEKELSRVWTRMPEIRDKEISRPQHPLVSVDGVDLIFKIVNPLAE